MTTIFSWMRRHLFAVLVLLLAVMAATGCSGQDKSASPGAGTPIESLTRVDGGQNGVTIEATWVTPSHLEQMPKESLQSYLAQGAVLVHLTLDTHSVDLSKYDLARLATLAGQTGGVGATGWVGIEEDSHHRDGVLVFPGWSNECWAEAQGKAELTLRDIAGMAERVFRWIF